MSAAFLKGLSSQTLLKLEINLIHLFFESNITTSSQPASKVVWFGYITLLSQLLEDRRLVFNHGDYYLSPRLLVEGERGECRPMIVPIISTVIKVYIFGGQCHSFLFIILQIGIETSTFCIQ